MIYKAIKINILPDNCYWTTVGPFWGKWLQFYGICFKIAVPMVDEHYYMPPAWLINNQDFLWYIRPLQTQVYLGEYAAHVRNRSNNIETALAEALYLCSVEKNGDVFTMTLCAALLAKERPHNGTRIWSYFNNSEVKTNNGLWSAKTFWQQYRWWIHRKCNQFR